MFRCLVVSFMALLILLFAVSLSYSEYRFNDGTKIEVQWYEKKGQILNDGVCFNYKDNRRQFKQCRKKAKDYFEEECEFYTDKIKKTVEKYKEIYFGERDKFCNAASQYTP